MGSLSLKRILVILYAPAAILYLLLSFKYPTDPATIALRHLSLAEARTIAISFAAVMIAIWGLAIYASWKLREYSQSIKDYKDGKAFMYVAYGLQLLAVYLPLRSLMKISLNYLAHLHPSLSTASYVIITLINVLVPLAVYLLISVGGYALSNLVRGKIPNRHMYYLIAVFCIISAVYCYAVFSPQTRLTPADWLITIDYKINYPLRIFTIAVPNLFMWAIGLIATYHIYLYQKRVKGVFYRDSLRPLSLGLALEILASIVGQFVTAIAANIRHFPTDIMLAIVIAILSLTAAAYLLMIKGVRKLNMFESSS